MKDSLAKKLKKFAYTKGFLWKKPIKVSHGQISSKESEIQRCPSLKHKFEELVSVFIIFLS